MTADFERPRRVLMTVDAVGGVWRYAMDVGCGLRAEGVDIVYAGFGPRPDTVMVREAEENGELHWFDAPLDWLADGESELAAIPGMIAGLAEARHVDLLHLNLPSQAARLETDLPVVVAAHSCVATWFATMRGTLPPPEWAWHEELTLRGFEAADMVIAPSRSHADLLTYCYGIRDFEIVPYASRHVPRSWEKKPYALAVSRWWDQGKNGRILDEAAARSDLAIIAVGPSAGPNGESMTFYNVDHRGQLPFAETMALLNDAGIFVSPSIYEPFGLGALEAARSGSALVLSDTPTYRELWDDAALFADPGDAEGFSDAINRLAGDLRLRRSLALHAQERSRQFSLRHHVDVLFEVYGRARARQSGLSAAI